MKKYILSFLLLLTYNSIHLLKAQDEYRASLPSVLPMSPNMAAMAQYVDYPVSHYTGVPNINIPLYELDIYGYKLPISLSYHASGIKVSQEASWVGLGWSLNVGGAITRSIKCTDDLKLTWKDGLTVVGYYEATEIAGKSNMPPVDPVYENDFFYCNSNGGVKLKVDTEPDIFYYSFPGSSGKFVIDKSRGPLIISKDNNVKIEIKKNYSYYFTITTPNGTQYIFDEEEYTTMYSQNNKHLNKNYTINGVLDYTFQSHYGEEFLTGWHLSKIILPNKKEIIFTYIEEYITSPTQESLRVYYNNLGTTNQSILGCSYALGERYSVSKSHNHGYRLSKISWDGGAVDFIPCDRYDLNGTAKALKNIKIQDSSNELVKQFNFEYSYFNNSYYSTSNEYIYLRLKLDCVYENKINYVGQIPAYKFNYFEGEMPAKNSKNTDYWGYYNNGKYGANYCAKVYYYPNTLGGVLKNSNYQYLKLGTLNKITLPTGGNVTYEYEENTFNNNGWAFDNIVQGAGLRVKKITTDAKNRTFTYAGGNLLIEPVLFALDVICSGGRYRPKDVVVQLSEPKLSLSSLSGGNTIGYDRVEESITDGTNTSKICYEFYNDPEEEWYEEVMHDFPTHPNYYNGLPYHIVSYENGRAIEEVEYYYKPTLSQRVEAFRWDPIHFVSYNYHYQMVWVQKEKEVVRRKYPSQAGELLSEKRYNFNNYFQLSNSNLVLDATANEIQEQITYYPTDYSDAISQAMANAYLIGVPVETIGLRDGQVISGKKTVYKQVNNMFLPDIVYTLDTDAPRTKDNYRNYYNPKLYFDIYNDYGKISQVRDNGISIAYLWGYNSQYPIAEIKNATYQDVITAMGGTTVIKGIESKAVPSADDWTKINSLRDHSLLKNASILIYKYRPLIGTSEINDPRNISSYFDYDNYGRLEKTSFDNNGTKTLLEKYLYNYK